MKGEWVVRLVMPVECVVTAWLLARSETNFGFLVKVPPSITTI